MIELQLLPRVAEQALASGWAEIHPVAMRGMIPMNIVMLYAPRNADELVTVLEWGACQ